MLMTLGVCDLDDRPPNGAVGTVLDDDVVRLQVNKLLQQAHGRHRATKDENSTEIL
jgi:hypothetical protein